jgi:hypothetical protein
MKLKSGKDLSQLEIIKRLNTMGIEYNSDIIGKNYYIKLYNEAIQSKENLIKIKKDIEKDKMYSDFYNQKLRIVPECSLGFRNEKKIIKKTNFNTKNLVKNNSQKGFFCDYECSLWRKLMITRIAYDFVDANGEMVDKVGNNIPKLLIPIEALKKYTMINIYPTFKTKLGEIMDILNNLFAEKFLLISIIIFFALIIIIIFLLYKERRRNHMK